MPDIHRGAKQLRIPFRFEKRRVPFPLLAQSVFVAVKNIGLRKFRGRACELVKREGREDIVMIEACDKIARRHLQRVVGVSGDAKVFRDPLHANSRIASFPLA